MTVAEMVRAMAAAGASAEAIAIAVEAVESRDLKEAERKAERAAARKRQRQERDSRSDVARHGSDNTANVADKGSPKDIYQTPSQNLSDANASAGLASPKDRVWAKVPDLAVLAGRAQSSIRSFLGKCFAEFDADIVERAVLAALAEGSGDPCAFITRILKPAQTKARASPYAVNGHEDFDPEALKAERRRREEARVMQ